MCIHSHIHSYTLICIHTYTHKHKYTHTHTYSHIRRNIHSHTPSDTHTHTHACSPSLRIYLHGEPEGRSSALSPPGARGGRRCAERWAEPPGKGQVHCTPQVRAWRRARAPPARPGLGPPCIPAQPCRGESGGTGRPRSHWGLLGSSGTVP